MKGREGEFPGSGCMPAAAMAAAAAATAAAVVAASPSSFLVVAASGSSCNRVFLCPLRAIANQPRHQGRECQSLLATHW
jgi:hypothetical protein